MAIDRWIALIVGLLFLIYGYTAFFGMDHMLPPILKRDPVWPSTFPKILSTFGLVATLAVLVNLEKSPKAAGPLDLRKWRQYEVFEAVALVAGMGVYALALRPLGFMLSTFIFLALGGALLGERRLLLLVTIPAVLSYLVWQLIDSLLGIHLPPFPAFLGGG